MDIINFFNEEKYMNVISLFGYRLKRRSINFNESRIRINMVYNNIETSKKMGLFYQRLNYNIDYWKVYGRLPDRDMASVKGKGMYNINDKFKK